jgi:hypothetical protein
MTKAVRELKAETELFVLRANQIAKSLPDGQRKASLKRMAVYVGNYANQFSRIRELETAEVGK